jgi:mono/diheme cytochrome c family protein
VLREFLIASFSDEHGLRDAVTRIRESGYKIYDVYAPYPIHGLDEAMGLRRSRLPIVGFLAGVMGLFGALAMQFYCAVLDWPVNVGGKPLNSTLAFIPISFELTVLSAGLCTVAAFLVRSRLFPGAKAVRFEHGTTDDAFVLVLRRRDATFDAGEARRLLVESGARNVTLREVQSRTSFGLAWGVVLIAAALSGSACVDHTQKPGFEYMPDMVHSLAYDSFAPNPVTRDHKTMQAPVAGTIPRGFLPLHYQATPADAERAGRELKNPLRRTPETLAHGKVLYETFCIVCHGASGLGDGPLVPRIPNPPSYTSERVRWMPAGQLFHVTTYGSGRMPSYASQTTPEERWQIVMYVQTLQVQGTKP